MCFFHITRTDISDLMRLKSIFFVKTTKIESTIYYPVPFFKTLDNIDTKNSRSIKIYKNINKLATNEVLNNICKQSKSDQNTIQ